jgi:hypothetical protein
MGHLRDVTMPLHRQLSLLSIVNNFYEGRTYLTLVSTKEETEVDGVSGRDVDAKSIHTTMSLVLVRRKRGEDREKKKKRTTSR